MSKDKTAAFRERARCVLCQGASFDVLWEGRFCDEPVRSWMRASRYTGGIEHALGEETFTRVQCRDCGLSFHRRILDDEWMRTLYTEWISSAQVDAFEADRRATQPEAAAFIGGAQRVKHLLRLQHLSGGNRQLKLLDFGCGDGRFLGLAAAFGFKAFGVDFSASRQARAQRSGISIASSLDELGSGDDYDCVTLFEVLEHVAAPREILGALYARMRPGATLLIEVPDCRGIQVPKSSAEFDAVQPLEHINHFTAETLVRFCRDAGFVSVPRVPAHVTTQLLAIVKTELSRFVRPSTTSQYFRRA